MLLRSILTGMLATALCLLSLKVPSKSVVVTACNDAFQCRNNNHLPKGVIQNTAKSLGVNDQQCLQMMTSLCGLIKKALFLSSSDPTDIVSLFPADFHKNLRDLLAKIILEHLSQWQNQAIQNMVFLPRLVDFDWRVDIKTSADNISRMSVPTCILQMQVDETSTRVNQVSETSLFNVELSKETLDAMLDGLGKIRDQLSSVADKS